MAAVIIDHNPWCFSPPRRRISLGTGLNTSFSFTPSHTDNASDRSELRRLYATLSHPERRRSIPFRRRSTASSPSSSGTTSYVSPYPDNVLATLDESCISTPLPEPALPTLSRRERVINVDDCNDAEMIRRIEQEIGFKVHLSAPTTAHDFQAIDLDVCAVLMRKRGEKASVRVYGDNDVTSECASPYEDDRWVVIVIKIGETGRVFGNPTLRYFRAA